MKTDPSVFPRRILLATVGLAPQIVTETLYALCLPQDRSRDKAFVPNEIHIITTAEGEKHVRRMLLDPPQPQLARFAAEYGFPELAEALTPDRIHVMKDAAGEKLADISSKAHNEATADLIIRTLYDLTRDKRSAVHVSIAGGRKTMGCLLGTALSLFGRPQDRLSQVLVTPQPLEQHPEFFYPPRQPRLLQDQRNPANAINTQEACIALADIPFVRLRHGLPDPLLEGAWSFSETVARAQAAVAEPELILDPSSQHVSCHGIVFYLSPMLFTLYAAIARRRLASPADDGFVHWTQISAGDFLAEFEKLPKATNAEISRLCREFAKIGQPGYDINNDPRASKYEQAKNRLNDHLQKQLGPYSTSYKVKNRKAANSQWLMGLDMPAASIRFEPLNVGDPGEESD